jgi:hypothetical protein
MPSARRSPEPLPPIIRPADSDLERIRAALLERAPEQLLATAEAGLARARAALDIYGRRVDGTALARHLATACLALQNLLVAEEAITEREDQTGDIMQAVRDIARGG